jgi:hypothetical protein
LSYDDHPSTVDFLQLHLLQSLYIPVKGLLSSAANCKDVTDKFLSAFTSNLKILAREQVVEAVEKKVTSQPGL